MSETNTGEENAQALRYCADRGKVYIRAGDYPLHRFQFVDGDDIVGSGYNTNILSTSNIAVAFGNWSGDSFTGSVSEYSVIDPPSRFDTTITFPLTTDSDNYSIGDPIVIWSDAGRITGASTFIPAYLHITEIKAISPGEVTIAHPIYRSVPMVGGVPSEIRITSAAQMGGYSNLDPRWARDVTLSNLSFTSAGDSWSRYGGALRANVSNIWVRDSNSIFVQNGIAYSNFSFRKSQYHDFALDMAMGCQHTNVLFDEAYCDSSLVNENPAIAFAECCHDNYVNAKNVFMMDKVLKDAAVSFKTGSADNVFEGNVFAHTTRRLVKQHHTANLEGVIWEGQRGNMIRNTSVKGVNSSYLLSVGSDTPGEMSKFSSENSYIESENNSAVQFDIYGSQVDISGTTLNGQGLVRVNDDCEQVDISNVKCLRAPSSNAISQTAQVKSDGIILDPATWT
ncbi:MAG: hypothetical protein AB2766_11570 [Candidatus Thiodiazotropha endolucinida]